MDHWKLGGAIVATMLMALTLGACGEQDEESTSATDTESLAATSESPAEDQTPTVDDADVDQAPYGEPTPCTDLLHQGWTAPETEPDISFDPESGHAKVVFTEPEDALVVDVATDAACAKLPDIGRFLARLMPDEKRAMREACEDLVATLNAGELPERDGMTADPEGMREYVLTECPKDLAKQLAPADGR